MVETYALYKCYTVIQANLIKTSGSHIIIDVSGLVLYLQKGKWKIAIEKRS